MGLAAEAKRDMRPLERGYIIMKGWTVGLTLSLAVAMTPASAQGPGIHPSTLTTADLTLSCRQPQADTGAGLCGGYARAVFDQLTSSYSICPKTGITSQEVVAVARKYLADHHQKSEHHPAHLLRVAFYEAFPCESQAQ
jgi:hypothetical protein